MDNEIDKIRLASSLLGGSWEHPWLHLPRLSWGLPRLLQGEHGDFIILLGGGANPKPQTYMIQARRILFHPPPVLMSFPCGYYRLGRWGDAASPLGWYGWSGGLFVRFLGKGRKSGLSVASARLAAVDGMVRRGSDAANDPKKASRASLVRGFLGRLSWQGWSASSGLSPASAFGIALECLPTPPCGCGPWWAAGAAICAGHRP